MRDPAGCLHFVGDTPVRRVYAESAGDCRALVDGPLFRGLMAGGKVVDTRVLEPVPAELAGLAGPGDLLLHHEAVPFPSFPAEWPAEMLHAAARLTLEIALRALDHGLGLKDATPYNVLFSGTCPVFVDVLSFERRDPCDPVWLAQGQFLRTFLLPLLAHGALGLPLSALFLGRRDGVEPAELYRMLGPIRRCLPPFLGAVTIPVWLSAKAEASGPAMYRPRRLKNAEQARFVMKSMWQRLSRGVDRALAAQAAPCGGWSDYGSTCSYLPESFDGKSDFVGRFLDEYRPASVLDVGCNTGHFSELAASRGARVVAIDQDPAVVGALWSRARAHNPGILPLLVDFARPTPATGWDNAENPSFLERARGRFDAVFMLAVIHHLTVTDQIPLSEVLAQAASLTRRHLVIEYVAPDDPQFCRLTRGRDALYRELTRERFEAVAGERFNLLQGMQVEGQNRWLYVLEKRG